MGLRRSRRDANYTYIDRSNASSPPFSKWLQIFIFEIPLVIKICEKQRFKNFTAGIYRWYLPTFQKNLVLPASGSSRQEYTPKNTTSHFRPEFLIVRNRDEIFDLNA
jgi:hypothetical protein